MTNPKEALEWYERKRVEARAMADRDCKNCKHNKPDGCSRWECEYVPRTDALISRQDAIDECDKQYPNIDRQDFKAVINAVPSADRPTGWIPVSERLPEDTSKPVLISGISGNYKGLGVYAVDIARYNGGMWQYDGFAFPDCDILAWMPLPEPYKGGDSE